MDRDFVVADADLSPERRLVGTKGQGLATYRELMTHLSTRTRPDGGAGGHFAEMDCRYPAGHHAGDGHAAR